MKEGKRRKEDEGREANSGLVEWKERRRKEGRREGWTDGQNEGKKKKEKTTERRKEGKIDVIVPCPHCLREFPFGETFKEEEGGKKEEKREETNKQRGGVEEVKRKGE
jgi:hypothetical protein